MREREEWRRFLKEINARPSLEKKEEAILAFLWIEWKCEWARNRLIENHLKFVAKLAYYYAKRNPTFDVEELFGEGVGGLTYFANKRDIRKGAFDISRGNRFSTPALYWIKDALRGYIYKHEFVVKGVSASDRAQLQKRGSLAYGRLPTSVTSLNHKVESTDDSSSAMTHMDLIESEEDTPEENLAQQELESILAEAVRSLPEQEQTIIREHFGEQEMTCLALGERFGFTRQRAQQLKKRALEKIKRYLELRHPGFLQAYHSV